MISKGNLNYYRSLLNNTSHIANSIFPKKFLSRESLMDFFKVENKSKEIKIPNNLSVESINKGMMDPSWSMLSRKGKQWRPLLGLIAANAFINDLDNFTKHKKLYELLYIADFFHNSTLILDDIQDQSLSRRGKKCVHLLFGEPITINAGISLMLIPVGRFISNLTNNLQKVKISETFFEESTSVLMGQNWDIEMTPDHLPTIDNYLDTALCKTGVCPRMVIKFVKNYIETFLNQNTGYFFEQVLDLSDDISLGFQIWDDLMNLRSSTISKNKNLIGEDITEGKLTPMVIHSLSGNFQNKSRLKQILKMRTRNQKTINEAIDILNKNGSVKFAEILKDKYINRFENKVFQLIKKDKELKKINQHIKLDVLKGIIELKNSLIKI